MPSTYLSLNFHLVFSTKNREPTIRNAWKERLHEYLGGTIRGLGGFPEGVGGTADHVHLLVGLKATHCLADVLRDIKAGSSRWMHDEMGLNEFAWQEGYGAFTVSVSQLETVKSYIDQQEEHHRVKSFQEEYVEVLNKWGVEFDERDFW